MSAIVVGHGPSIMMEEMGHLIDEFDTVIRIKRCHETLKQPEYFGSKTNVVVGSMNIAGGLRDLPAKQFWIVNDSRHEDYGPDVYAQVERMMPADTITNKNLSDKWDERYRALREELLPDFSSQMSKSHSSDEFGERHLSQGFKAMLFAAHYLDEPVITLVGFDNMYTGHFTWSITRGPDWQNYPKHRWDVEHVMVRELEAAYGVKFAYLLPDCMTPQHEDET